MPQNTTCILFFFLMLACRWMCPCATAPLIVTFAVTCGVWNHLHPDASVHGMIHGCSHAKQRRCYIPVPSVSHTFILSLLSNYRKSCVGSSSQPGTLSWTFTKTSLSIIATSQPNIGFSLLW